MVKAKVQPRELVPLEPAIVRGEKGHFLKSQSPKGGRKRGPDVQLTGVRGLLRVLNDVGAKVADNGSLELALSQYAETHGVLAMYDRYLRSVAERVAAKEIEREPVPAQRIIVEFEG